MRVSTMVIHWLLRTRTIAAELSAADNANATGIKNDTGNGELENAVDSINDNDNIVEQRDSDFSEGSLRILSGICANISKAICSTTMLYLIVSNE